jgi:hypothetical protein
MTNNPADRISIHIGGNVTGQVVSGQGNVVNWQTIQASGSVTVDELDQLHAAFNELRTRLEVDTEECADSAQDKLDELEEAITGEQLDIPTMEYVHGWFRRKLPGFASAVGKLIINPIVGKLVATAGDDLVSEFAHRFGV